MGNRMNLYVAMRKIHLYAAMVVLTFLLMYFVTGFLIARYNWFDHDEPSPEVKELEMDLTGLTDPDQVAGRIEEKYGIVGKRQYLREDPDGSLRMEYLKPGRSTKVTVTAGKKSVRIETKDQNLFRTISTYHRLHGYGGGFVYDIYLVMMDLASFSLLIFTITGIYLWFKVIKKKKWGLIFLAAGVLYTLWVYLTFVMY